MLKELKNRVISKIRHISYSVVSRVRDALNFTTITLAQAVHLHSEYYLKDEYPVTKRLNELKASEFAPRTHEHSQYLRKDTPARNTAAVGGLMGSQVENREHTHPTYQTYIRTSPTEVRSANRLITEGGLIVLPSVDKARRIHVHPQYIRKDGYVPLARNFAAYSRKGVRLLYSPQAFARRIHEHDWDYYTKDEAVGTFATRAEVFDRAGALAPKDSTSKLKLVVFEIDNNAAYSSIISYPVKYLPLKTADDLNLAVLKAVTKEEEGNLDLTDYFDVTGLIFIYAAEPNNVAEACFHHSVLSPRTLLVELSGGSYYIKSFVTTDTGQKYFSWIERQDGSFQQASDFGVVSDYPLGAIAVDESFSLRSQRAAEYAPDVLIDPPNPERLIINREPRFPAGTDADDYAYHHDGVDSIDAEDSRVLFLHENKRVAGPAVYVDVGTSDEIADAMENFFGDSAILIFEPATVNLNIRLNNLAKDAPSNSSSTPESVTVPESQTLIDPSGNFSIISLNTALASMDEDDYVYVHLGRVSFKNKLFANLAILWLRLFGLYHQVIVGVQNSITFFVNSLLAGLYPLAIRLPDIWIGPGAPPEDDYKYINLEPIFRPLHNLLLPVLDVLDVFQETWDSFATTINNIQLTFPVGWWTVTIDPIPAEIPTFPFDIPSSDEWLEKPSKILLPWIFFWILDGYQLDYSIPIMESTVYGNKVESYVLFKRVKVSTLRELYTRFNSLSLFGASPLIIGEHVLNPSLLFLPLDLEMPAPVTVQSNVYATIANHAIQLEGYRIVHAQVVPGRGTVSFADGIVSEIDQDIPTMNKSHHILGAAGSKAVRTYVPTSYGHMGPKLIGFLNDEVFVRAGGQPYVLYLWVADSSA